MPYIEGDTGLWGPLGYATVTAWKDKLIIIGGENKHGETHNVWILRQLEPISRKEMLRRKGEQEETHVEEDEISDLSRETTNELFDEALGTGDASKQKK